MDDFRSKTEKKWSLPNEGMDRHNQLERYYLFARHSAQIESHLMGEENGQLLLENQRKCCGMLLEKVKEHTPLTIELLKSMHEVLLHGIIKADEILNAVALGAFRETADGHEAVGSEAEDIERELRELFEEVEVYSTGAILNEAAYLHGKIVEIYPFAYGNEIIGRNIMNYYLMRNGQNPLAIFSEERESYYNALGNYCDTGSLEELLGFLAWQSMKTKDEMGRPTFDGHQP